MGNDYNFDLVLSPDQDAFEPASSEITGLLAKYGWRPTRTAEDGDWNPPVPPRSRDPPRANGFGVSRYVSGDLALAPLSASAHRGLDLLFADVDPGPWSGHLSCSVYEIPNAWWGVRMSGPSVFYWLHLGTSIRSIDWELCRILLQFLDPIMDDPRALFLQLTYEGTGPPFDLYRNPFPPPHIEFRQLGEVGLLPPFLRDKVLDGILRRFEAGDYDDPEQARVRKAERLLGLQRVKWMPRGAVRFISLDGRSLAGHALAKG